MKKSIEQVEHFMKAAGQLDSEDDYDMCDLYVKLISEEYNEFQLEGVYHKSKEELKELCDLLWVLIGYSLAKGYDLAGAFNEVARSNMSKIDLATGKILKREDGKVLKPDHYKPADVSEYV